MRGTSPAPVIVPPPRLPSSSATCTAVSADGPAHSAGIMVGTDVDLGSDEGVSSVFVEDVEMADSNAAVQEEEKEEGEL